MIKKMEDLLNDLIDSFLLKKTIEEDILKEITELAVTQNKKEVLEEFVRELSSFILYEDYENQHITSDDFPSRIFAERLLDKES